MTVTAEIIEVQVNAEAQSAAVTVSVQIGNGSGSGSGEVTKSAVDESIGASSSGSATKFYNEMGEWATPEGGVVEPEYDLTIDKSDVIWNGTYIQIAHTEAVNALKMTNISFTVDTVGGLRELEAVVIYPAPETNVTTGVSYFLVRDASGFLKPETNFDKVHLSYNVIADTVSKYDIKYKLTGENIVNNHEIGGSSDHSRQTTQICNIALKEYMDTLEIIRTDEDISSMVTNEHQPRYFEKNDANISFSPIVFWYQNQDLKSNADIMEVFSHYNNDFKRHDTTAAEDIFFENSVAVSARSEDIEDHTGATSWGFGLEFMEDLSKEKVDAEYGTERLFENWFCGATTDASGTIITSPTHPDWINVVDVEVGVSMWRWDSEYNKFDITYITEILSANSVRVSPAVTPSEVTVIYFAGKMTLSNFLSRFGGVHGSQSSAVPVVAAKLKRIRLATNASWNQVRMAARATASNNGIWDMYRGFGIINVEAAITYIQENYHTDDYVDELAKQLENDRQISPLLKVSDIKENSPLPKRHINDCLATKQNTLTFSTDIEADKESTTKVSAIKTFYDWVVGLFQKKTLYFTNKTVLTTDFVVDTTYADYGYKAVISCTGVTSTMLSEVTFAPIEADSGNYAAVCLSGTGTVTIYAKTVPSGTITIPTIKAEVTQ